MIILLDLNYTLVANSHEKRSPFAEQVARETYRADLVELIRPYKVLLVTARPPKYSYQTLQRIAEETDWQPQTAYFNDLNLPPPALKERLFRERIQPTYGDTQYLAIESNPRTRAMYAALGVTAVPVDQAVEQIAAWQMDGA